MIVKICGITTLEDGLAAIQAGADWLGFNFFPPSPRYLSPAACAEICVQLRAQFPQIVLVGVFVDSAPKEIETIEDGCGLDLAQLSGSEPPEHLALLGQRAFKALRPADAAELQALIKRYPPRSTAPAYLLDAYHPSEYGGTGRRADWQLAAGLARQAPILLAGGLRPENVAAAVAQVNPWGVDVASGVESAPGRKDASLMQAFVRAAK
jgi:phosphoribosylanthranilate isomerase